jgi:hypothetical protein
MNRKKGKTVSFDAMVKYFMQTYNIPTKKDVDRLMAKLDRIETLMKKSGVAAGRRRVSAKKPGMGVKESGRAGSTAVDEVFKVIKSFRQGAGFADIKIRTGFDDKKIRNIIYRLTKLDRINRKSRGIYIAK